MLSAYLRSLRAVVQSQFTKKASRGGRHGVIEMLESSPVTRVLPHQATHVQHSVASAAALGRCPEGTLQDYTWLVSVYWRSRTSAQPYCLRQAAHAGAAAGR